MKFKKITVFCGASPDINPKYEPAMEQTGALLAENDAALIFGIGDKGLMGAVFRGARSKDGYVIGVTTQKLLDLQCKDIHVFDHNAEIDVVDNLNIRKTKMIQDADAILVGPGGWGTYDEFSEMAVQIQIHAIQRKPLLFLNFEGYWNSLKDHIQRMKEDGFINDDKTNYIGFVDTVDEIFPALEEMQLKIDALDE